MSEGTVLNSTVDGIDVLNRERGRDGTITSVVGGERGLINAK